MLIKDRLLSVALGHTAPPSSPEYSKKKALLPITQSIFLTEISKLVKDTFDKFQGTPPAYLAELTSSLEYAQTFLNEFPLMVLCRVLTMNARSPQSLFPPDAFIGEVETLLITYSDKIQVPLIDDYEAATACFQLVKECNHIFKKATERDKNEKHQQSKIEELNRDIRLKQACLQELKSDNSKLRKEKQILEQRVAKLEQEKKELEASTSTVPKKEPVDFSQKRRQDKQEFSANIKLRVENKLYLAIIERLNQENVELRTTLAAKSKSNSSVAVPQKLSFYATLHPKTDISNTSLDPAQQLAMEEFLKASKLSSKILSKLREAECELTKELAEFQRGLQF